MDIAIVILCIAISFLIIESLIIKKSVTTLQLRIHVNGTRGKSSVTEYIAAGLLKGYPEVMSKVTGVVPTVSINGKDQVLGRSGVARVQEQFDIIKKAARKNVNSLVLECMSITPDLQRLESRIFKPHIYVITNIRDDHRESMGMSLETQAQSICDAIPENSTVVTNETRFLKLIQENAGKKDSRVVIPDKLETILKNKLPPGVFSENVSLAMTVCDLAGVGDTLAGEGIIDRISQNISPFFQISNGEKKIDFLNAFSANDVDSTRSFIDFWKEKSGYCGKFSVILNTRDDRPLRTDQFVLWIVSILPSVQKIFITGTHYLRAKSLLRKRGVNRDCIHIWKRADIDTIKKNLLDTVPDRSMVVGLGNIGGDGKQIINILA